MSSTTRLAGKPVQVRFGELLEERYKHTGESQGDVADWLNDWMDHHDLLHELEDIERTVDDDLRDITMDAIAIIRHYYTTNAQASNYQVGQAAVSKWRNGRDGKNRPSPEKWVALARYLELPLGELYRLLVYSELPRSIPALQHRVVVTDRENRKLRDENRKLAAQNERNERLLLANVEEIAAVKRRLELLELEESTDFGEPAELSV